MAAIESREERMVEIEDRVYRRNLWERETVVFRPIKSIHETGQTDARNKYSYQSAVFTKLVPFIHPLCERSTVSKLARCT